MSEENQPKSKKKRVVKSSVIDHSYHDYCHVPIQNIGVTNSAVSTARRPNFPAKLHQIVSTPGYQHIIPWLPHGRSWTVRNKELLVSVVLKEHFSHGNFESFNRQVNLWGFKRLFRAGTDYKSYYHEAFLRGRPDLTPLVRRLNNAGKRIPNLASEPNFYQMPVLPGLEVPYSGMFASTAAGVNIAAQASPSSDSNIGGHSARERQFEQYTAASSSKDYPDAAPQCQQSQSPYSHPMPPILCSHPASSGIGYISNHTSDRKRNSSGNSYPFSDRQLSHESVRLAEFGNLKKGSPDDSRMECAHEFSTASVGQNECQPHEQGISNISHSSGENCSQEYDVHRQSAIKIHQNRGNESNVSPAVTIFGSSYSSGNMTPYASAYSSSSGQNDDNLNRKVTSNESVASKQHTCGNTISEPNEARALAANSLRHDTLGQQSIALLSSPPNDPLLEEFAREYLPHFGKQDDNHR